jgi:hypothetical protein
MEPGPCHVRSRLRINSKDIRSELSSAFGKYLMVCQIANVAEDQTGLPVEKRPVCCLQKNLQAKKVITEHREV